MPYYFDGYSDKSLSLHYYVVTNVRYPYKIIKHCHKAASGFITALVTIFITAFSVIRLKLAPYIEWRIFRYSQLY